MKGLLLKDLYMARKYCRSYLLLAVVFLGVSFFTDSGLYLTFYACLFCGMIPVTLLAYDERSHWQKYSGTMPYSKTQIVAEKYLIGAMAQVIVLLFIAVVQYFRLRRLDAFDGTAYFLLLSAIFAVSMAASSVNLFFMFRFGVEKGRIAYYVLIGFTCAGSFLLSDALDAAPASGMAAATFLPALLFLAGILIFAVFLLLSIRAYARREIT